MVSETQTTQAAGINRPSQTREGFMLLVSSVDVAISLAKQAGTLRITEAINRFGDTYFAVEDDHGVITTCFTQAEVEAVTR